MGDDRSVLPDVLAELKRVLGVKLLVLILGITPSKLQKLIGKKLVVLEYEARTIYCLAYIIEVLKNSMSHKAIQLWLVSPSLYLHGIPAEEIRGRPEDVQLAALALAARGVDLE